MHLRIDRGSQRGGMHSGLYIHSDDLCIGILHIVR